MLIRKRMQNTTVAGTQIIPMDITLDVEIVLLIAEPAVAVKLPSTSVAL